MIELTNSSALTLTAAGGSGSTAIFDTTFLKCGHTECTRSGTGSIKLCCKGVYEIRFTGNIGTSGTTGVAQLNISIGGVNFPQGLITSETSTDGDLNAVERTFYVNNCCGDYDRITITNTGTTPVTIGAGAIFSATKVCSSSCC